MKLTHIVGAARYVIEADTPEQIVAIYRGINPVDKWQAGTHITVSHTLRQPPVPTFDEVLDDPSCDVPNTYGLTVAPATVEGEWIAWTPRVSPANSPYEDNEVYDVRYRSGLERFGVTNTIDAKTDAYGVIFGTSSAYWQNDNCDQDIIAHRRSM